MGCAAALAFRLDVSPNMTILRVTTAAIRGVFNTLVLAAPALFASQAAWSFDFVPTDADWSAWPRYCQVKYANTRVGGASDFAGSISEPETATWKARLGEVTYLHVHHFCAGMALYNRSRSVSDASRKLHLLNEARGEVLYTRSRVPAACLVCGDIASTLARIDVGLGNSAEAIDVLNHEIESNPQDLHSYLTLAVILRDLKRPVDAIDVLKKCDAVLDGKSAEVRYNLGLLYLEVKNFDLALEYAHKAYAQNHPLPGLRSRLQAIGRWADAVVASPATEQAVAVPRPE
jgi:tetratricopeptide (TPR) repeat protein